MEIGLPINWEILGHPLNWLLIVLILILVSYSVYVIQSNATSLLPKVG